MTKYLLAFLAAFSLLTAPAVAQTETAEKKQEEKQEESKSTDGLQEKIEEYNSINRDFQKKAGEIQRELSKDGAGPEKMREAYEKWQAELTEATAPILNEIVKFAEKAEADPDASMKAISFILDSSQDEEIRSKAIKLTMEHHLDHKELPSMLSTIGRGGMPSKSTIDFLKAVMEKSDNKSNQGIAAMSHVSIIEQIAQFAPMVRDNPEIKEQAPELFELIESFDEEQLSDDGLIKQLEAVAEKYGDIEVDGKRIEDSVASKLKVMRVRAQTSVGKCAPEIEGPDIDGVKFKLSDYRGKVVMLDFWGDW